MAFCTIITFGSSTVLLQVEAEEDNNNQQVIDEQRTKIQLGILKGNVELNQVKDEIEQINEQIGESSKR